MISNAIKFTPFGGDINITCKLVKSEFDLSIPDESFIDIMQKANDCTYLEIQVEDTGIGIKDEDKPKLFKLFGFLDSTQQINTKGIGLGLHISKRITRIFNGDIICRSE